MDVQEVRKLDAYLKKLFGNAHIRVVPRPKKRIPPKFMSAKNSSACCLSMMRTTTVPITSRWPSLVPIWNSLAIILRMHLRYQTVEAG